MCYSETSHFDIDNLWTTKFQLRKVFPQIRRKLHLVSRLKHPKEIKLHRLIQTSKLGRHPSRSITFIFRHETIGREFYHFTCLMRFVSTSEVVTCSWKNLSKEISQNQQYFFFVGEKLDDRRTVHYNIQNGTILHLVTG